MVMSPYTVVSDFEERLADWCGSKYCVCVESGTAAIFLSLEYSKYKLGWLSGYEIEIPNITYNSIPCSIIHCGFKVKFTNYDWSGEYELYPLNIWDAALRFRKGMYKSGLQCVSFHIKKHLPIGRGGSNIN